MSDVEQLRALWKSADQTARDDTLPAYIRERAEDLAETLQGVFAAAAATTNPPAAEVAQPPPPAAPLPLTAVPDGQHYNVTARDEKGAAAARTVQTLLDSVTGRELGPVATQLFEAAIRVALMEAK